MSTLSKLRVGARLLLHAALPVQHNEVSPATVAFGAGSLGRGVKFNRTQREFMSRFEASKSSRARAGTGNAAGSASFSQAPSPAAALQVSLAKRKALPFRGKVDK